MSNAEAEKAVAKAIEAGYRLIDTAYAYDNEAGVGRGVRASGVPRDEVFITSKLNGEWHGVAEAQLAFRESARRLGVDYLDLFLIHWPLPKKDRYVRAFEGLVKLLQDRHVRAIGVSNFKPAHIERILAETGVTPDVNQIQLNPSVTRDTVRAFNAAHGIATESWGPIGAGGNLLAHPSITRLAEQYSKTPAQIVLRWHLELDLIPIPKSSHLERQRANLQVFDFSLTPDEVATLSALDRGERAAVDSDVAGH
jgi:2,5-diketo-D-gluconate reductase A